MARRASGRNRILLNTDKYRFIRILYWESKSVRFPASVGRLFSHRTPQARRRLA